MNAPIIVGQLPADYCYPSNAQQLLDDFGDISHAEVPDNVTGVVFGPNEPGPTFPLWYNTTLDLMFTWDAGLGIRKARYWADANPDYRIWVEMTEAQVKLWDNPSGADATLGALTYTGPFWVVDHNYDARFPLGAGTLIAGAVAVGAIGGAEQKTLGPTHVAPHRHFLTLRNSATSYLAAEAAEVGEFHASSLEFEEVSGTKVGRTREAGGTGTPLAAAPFDIMPSYRVGHWVKRTGRLWYTP